MRNSDNEARIPLAGKVEDEFDSYLEKASQDPAFRAAYEDAQDRHSILDKLVGLRRLRRLSQTAVATRMGVRQPTVSGFETEDSDPRLSTLQRYARAVEARLRLVLTIPSDCDWVSPSATYCRSNPQGSSGAAVREGELAETWRAETQRRHGDRWAASA
jgi:transcriptional regulator with XRE-family HTH domain